MGKGDFSWFTGGSYLKGDNGKYSAEDAITTSFNVVESASLPMAPSAQQDELYSYMGLYFSLGQNCQYLY